MRALLVLVAVLAVVPVAFGKLPPPPEQSAVVKTGRAPCGLAARGNALWVGVYGTGSVLRLDRAGRVQQRLRVGRWACRLAVTDTAVWVTRDNADSVVRVDRRTGRKRALRIESPFDVLDAAGSIWVTSFETGTVTRVDPRTARPSRVHRVGGNPAGITRCAGRVWIGHGGDATWLTAIDPKTGRARRVDVVAESPSWPRCVRGQLWVTAPGAVLRVAPRTGELVGHLPLGGTPAEAAAAQGAVDGFWLVWVTDKERSLVHRIELNENRVVDSFPAGPGAYSVVRFAGSMWIASFAGADVRRFDP